ncbi:hypothetical protein C5B96_06285 [Subtercola sp. Z020]|nr:hypothetical protein C5B96_06285 [Subtercola sp. Z020]
MPPNTTLRAIAGFPATGMTRSISVGTGAGLSVGPGVGVPVGSGVVVGVGVGVGSAVAVAEGVADSSANAAAPAPRTLPNPMTAAIGMIRSLRRTDAVMIVVSSSPTPKTGRAPCVGIKANIQKLSDTTQ